MITPAIAARTSDPWEMALIHRLIRRGFEQAREFVLAVPAGAAEPTTPLRTRSSGRGCTSERACPTP
jgi:hypothetical protein